MSLLSSHDQQHITRMFLQERRINAVYAQLIKDLAALLERWRDSGRRDVWVRNKAIERLIDKRLGQFNEDFLHLIDEETLRAWNLSNAKNDRLVERFIANLSISKVVKEGMMRHNMEAYEAFRERKIDGIMSLSDRVWNLSEQTKDSIELFIESGIGAGRSAEQIARDLRQMLNNPDKVFRRVRDKSGKLVPSKPMKNYNPGRGVYRSARLNALRLVATETNMAYRRADYERWLQLDFVLGVEVSRSQNHKPCVVCDALVGKYPKDFQFVGWHPFCICYAVPIMLTAEDFADYFVNDVLPDDKVIKDIPVTARAFFEENDKYRENSYAGREYVRWKAD